MALYLTTTNHNEIFREIGAIVLSSLGRIYVLPNYMNNISFRYSYSEFILNINNIKTLSSKQIKDFNTYGTRYEDIIYEYNNISINTSEFVKYLEVSNSFMTFLIDNNINVSFEYVVKNYSSLLSFNDIKSLLKPVYVRYMMAKKNPQNLISIRKNIAVRNIRKVVLYDVPCIIEYSRLRLLDNFWIDLKENIEVKIQNPPYFTYRDYMCLSIGNIKKFDKVEIELFRETNPNSMNFSTEFGIKKIKLIGKGYY